MELLTTSLICERLKISQKEFKDKVAALGFLDNGTLTELGRSKGAEIWSKGDAKYIVWPVELFANEITVKSTRILSYVDDFDSTSERSEGEDYIADYFRDIDINFEEQHPIRGLEDEHASIRVADFYLPKYNIMVEFAGRWNRSEEEKKRYRDKKRIYIAHNIPCVWLYPDNLGTLHYFFHKRLEFVLNYYEKTSELRKYRLSQFLKQDGNNILGILLGFFVLFVLAKPWSENRDWIWIGCLIVLYNIYVIIKDLNIILRKNRSIKVVRLNKWED